MSSAQTLVRFILQRLPIRMKFVQMQYYGKTAWNQIRRWVTDTWIQAVWMLDYGRDQQAKG